ncbi:pyridoxal-phosphate-dependent aminotransferase family protein [Chloroflexota bacterium]
MNLRIPGPTPLPENVLKIMSKQMVNHRGKEFGQMLGDITSNLKTLFQTKNDIFVYTTSGTGGLEAAVVNVLSPGDKVLAVAIGVFGERFAQIAETYGANVTRLVFDYGTAADPDKVKQALDADPAIKAVLVTHNETSTGTTNDLETLSAVVKQYDKLLLVDAISSLGCIDLQVDGWNCDVVVTGSQKGWMAPPGTAMLSFSAKAWEAVEQSKMPKFYFDAKKAKSYLAKNQTPWTPGVSTFYALHLSLDMMVKEGLDSVFARHIKIAEKTRDGLKLLGLTLFADPKHASNTITSVKVTDGLDGIKLLKILEEEYDTIIAGGQVDLAGKIFRVGHLGHVEESDIDAVLDALHRALPKAGFAL